MKNSINLKIKNFYKRWNIPFDEKRYFSDFKNRTVSTIDRILGEKFLEDKKLEESYIRIVGKYVPKSFVHHPGFREIMQGLNIRIGFIGETKWFKNTKIFELLQKETDFIEYIKCLQALFWIDINDSLKKELSQSFSEDIRFSYVDVCIKSTKSGVIFYPKGARLLDERIINDVLDWLSSYPKIYNPFGNALALYQGKKYARELLDDLRFSLEQFFKKFLKIKKPYKQTLSNYLGNKSISDKIIKMYTELYKFFENYQNKEVKHNKKFNPLEIEFVIYLTGNFLRFLIQVYEKTKFT